jgi:FkbM family methyltransferase
VTTESPKLLAQRLLRGLGFYHRLKVSLRYDLYWKVADRSVVEDVAKEIQFYRGILCGFRPGDLIFDVGANEGYKTSIFLRLGAKVVAVEPDELNGEILEQKFLRYRLNPKPVVIVNRAVSDADGIETIWIDEPGSAKNTLSRKWVETLRAGDKRFGHALEFRQSKEIATTTLEQLMIAHGVPVFIKIDVEGHELNVLRGLRRPVPLLSFEVNLPEFRADGLQCVELLGNLAGAGKFNYTADCRKGLALDGWLGPGEFSQVLSQCHDESIEVLWKTSSAQGR